MAGSEWRSVPPGIGRLTRHFFRAIPSDAGSARRTVEAIGGFSSSASRKTRGRVAGLRRPGGAFGQLEYLTVPLKTDPAALALLVRPWPGAGAGSAA